MSARDWGPCRSPCNGQRRSLALAAIALVAVAANVNCAFAADESLHRYELRGEGTIAFGAPVQQVGRLRLKAALEPSMTVAATPALQSDARFALTATLAAQSLVCYSDTIFRDDFDGDGF